MNEPNTSLRYAPLGTLHPRNKCAYCGTSAAHRPMYRTQLVSTMAEALVCEDPVKCLTTRKKAAKNA